LFLLLCLFWEGLRKAQKILGVHNSLSQVSFVYILDMIRIFINIRTRGQKQLKWRAVKEKTTRGWKDGYFT
jgi:hypothetical protein